MCSRGENHNLCQVPCENPMKKPVKGKKMPKIKRRAKNGTWTLKKADTQFSAEIRARDKKCLYPGCWKELNLQCSHYIGRAHKATRYDPNNCIALCGTHHFWDKLVGFEYQKQRKEVHGFDGQYTLFMKSHLGEQAWLTLLENEKIFVKQKTCLEYYPQKSKL